MIKTGNGQPLAVGSAVRIHYWCALTLDALLKSDYIDTSEWHAAPVVITVGSGQLLEGLNRALENVRLGDTLRVTVPPGLAFGERGVPGRVPSDATLYFHVELSTP